MFSTSLSTTHSIALARNTSHSPTRSRSNLEAAANDESNEVSVGAQYTSLFKKEGRDYYCLKLSGDSVLGSEGKASSLALIKRTEKARDNDVILSVVDGISRVKKLKMNQDRIELHPIQSSGQIISIDSSHDFRIAGVVEGLFHFDYLQES